jgi:hypothetical protein
MDDIEILDKASQLIADARKTALELGASPTDIGSMMMDEASLGFMADGASLSAIQKSFQRYSRKRLPKFYASLRRAAGLKD